MTNDRLVLAVSESICPLNGFRYGAGRPASTEYVAMPTRRGKKGVQTRPGRPLNASDQPGTLGGHRRLKIYGRLDCPSALRYVAIGQYVRHRVFFADEATAIAAGYRPCARCLPGISGSSSVSSIHFPLTLVATFIGVALSRCDHFEGSLLPRCFQVKSHALAKSGAKLDGSRPRMNEPAAWDWTRRPIGASF